MKEWVSVRVGLPRSEIAIIVVNRMIDKIQVYPKFVAYDGESFVDIDGDVVPDVLAWQPAPVYNNRFEQVLSKLCGCAAHDTCEVKDCCYFVAVNELESLLEYTQNEGGNLL